jgi:hypothetical protein
MAARLPRQQAGHFPGQQHRARLRLQADEPPFSAGAGLTLLEVRASPPRRDHPSLAVGLHFPASAHARSLARGARESPHASNCGQETRPAHRPAAPDNSLQLGPRAAALHALPIRRRANGAGRYGAPAPKPAASSGASAAPPGQPQRPSSHVCHHGLPEPPAPAHKQPRDVPPLLTVRHAGRALANNRSKAAAPNNSTPTPGQAQDDPSWRAYRSP